MQKESQKEGVYHIPYKIYRHLKKHKWNCAKAELD